MSKAPNWTTPELTILSEHYPILGKCKELQDLFPNRTLDSICLKASRIGLKVVNNIRKSRTDTEYLSLLEKTNFIALEPYKGSTTAIKHMCCLCDYEWLTRPQHVLKEGAKCPQCNTSLKSATSASRKEEVATVLYTNGFIALSEYSGTLDKIKLKHIYCGYEWETVYSYIQQGSGCPRCNKGFGYIDKNNLPETASLYVLEIILLTGERFYKIGVTTRPIKLRVNEITSSIGNINLINIKVIHLIKGSGRSILDLEHKLLSCKYKYIPSINFVGYTEVLSIDSLPHIQNILLNNENI